MIEMTHFQSPFGELTVVAVKEGAVKIAFATESIVEIKKWCQKHLGMGITEGTEFTTQAMDQISNYLNGKAKALDFPVVHFNSSFNKKVLEAQRMIPYGETRSYAEVSKMVEHPRAFRAVGSANTNNPLPLYFPCHRIICSDGSLGGFGGGLEIKRFLLDLESRYF